MNNRRKKVLKRLGIVLGILAYLSFWGYLGYLAYGNNWTPGLFDGRHSLTEYIACYVSLFGIAVAPVGAGILFGIGYGLYKLVKWIFCPEKKVNPVPLPQKTKTDLQGPPKDLWDYGKDVELPENKKEERIINPWQNRVTAGGER